MARTQQGAKDGQPRKYAKTAEAFLWIRQEILGGVEQKKVSKLIGQSVADVEKYETGAKLPTGPKIEHIAKKVVRDQKTRNLIKKLLEEARDLDREKHPDKKYLRTAEVFQWIRQDLLGGIEQKEVGKLIGHDGTYVAGFEAGFKIPSEPKIRKIAELVGKTAAQRRLIAARLFEARVLDRAEYSEQENPLRAWFPSLKLKRQEWHSADRDAAEVWGREVRALMEGQGIDVAAVAKHVGVHPADFRKMLDGIVQPPRDTVRVVAAYLGADETHHLLKACYVPPSAINLLPKIEALIRATPKEQQTIMILLGHVLSGEIPQEPPELDPEESTPAPRKARARKGSTKTH